MLTPRVCQMWLILFRGIELRLSNVTILYSFLCRLGAMLRRFFPLFAVGGVGAAVLDAIERAPFPSSEDGEGKVVETNPAPDSMITYAARSMIIGSTCLLVNTGLKFFANVKLVDKEYFDSAFQQKDRPLLTVGTHQSVLDDPVLLCLMSPLKEQTYDTRRMRWGVCGEDICFKNKFLSTYFGAGKILPIQRSIHRGSIHKKGGGTEQARFEVLANKLVPGQWVHIFPEGFCCQSKVNETKSGFSRTYMRWGVGKMVARSKELPIIIPFYHDGLKNILPQDGDDNLVSVVPNVGKDVILKFGQPVQVHDLLETFYSEGHALSEHWADAPTEAERELYIAITARIANRLFELEKSVQKNAGVEDGKYKVGKKGHTYFYS